MRRVVITALAVAVMLVPAAAEAQLGGLGRKLKDRAQQKVEDRVEQRAEQAMNRALDSVECAATDQRCIDSAAAEGRQPVDAQGNTLSTAKPGQGAWTNYDFKPGERILYADDFRGDNVGDFPRRMEFRSGQIEIVEWNGGRWLSSGNKGEFVIPLPEVLPERFTIEFDLIGSGNGMNLAFHGGDSPGDEPRFDINSHSGWLRATPVRGEGELGLDTRERQAHIAIAVDGQHVKMYSNEKRVFNVPNANMGRSNRIMFKLNGWSAEDPRMIANVRIAAGGNELYSAIEAEGRVATQGILFDTGSDRIRPESTPTLKEIGDMLKTHGDLKLLIEGHTDNVGAADMNQALSEKRAAAVRQYLIDNHGIDAARLTSQGFGASTPAASNDTVEGRQQNRRVELVKQ